MMKTSCDMTGVDYDFTDAQESPVADALRAAYF